MTSGLNKDRMTVFHENGNAYQAFNTITGKAKVFVYVPIGGGQFVHCADMIVDHPIANEEELRLIAIENEALKGE